MPKSIFYLFITLIAVKIARETKRKAQVSVYAILEICCQIRSLLLERSVADVEYLR